LVIVDSYSKFILLYPTKSTGAQEAVNGILSWIGSFNPPKFITADGAKAFLSEIMSNLMDTYGCDLHICSSYIHTGNSIVERSNRIILKLFRTLMSEMRIHSEDWMQLVPLVQLSINNFKRKRIGNYAACQVMTGTKDINQLKLMLNKKKDIQIVTIDEYKDIIQSSVQDYVEAQEQEQIQLIEILSKIGTNRHNKNQKQQEKKKNYQPIDVDIGDYVLIAVPESKVPTAKLLSRWKGPYLVQNILSNYIIEVKNLNEEKIIKVHISRIRKFNNILNNTIEDLKEQFAYYADNLYVESVVGHKKFEEEYRFLVHWHGFETASDSYEPAKYIQEVAPNQVEIYLNSLIGKERKILMRFLQN